MIPPCDEPIRINFQEEKKMRENQLLSTRNVTVMGMFGALAAVLMLFEVPLPFIAPSFYGLDLSEVPIRNICIGTSGGCGYGGSEDFD